MNLTIPQLQTLKAWVVANRNSVFDQGTVNALNALSSPDYFIFKPTINLDEVMTNGYDWTVVDNETVGQARIWDRMLAMSRAVGGISPWKITILQGVGEAYKGGSPASVPLHRRSILRTHFPRKCSVFEKLYVAAIADWNVGTNGDKTGNRGLNTNPDVMPMDAAGEYLTGPIDLDTLVLSEGS